MKKLLKSLGPSADKKNSLETSKARIDQTLQGVTSIQFN